MRTFLFYDLETTGLNKAFDQILQFAAIRTDETLKEIERHVLKIKLNPDVIPSPAACLTHQISVQEMSEGITEWEAIKQIHQWVNQPNTMSMGYNTLDFDDEFLRFSFYRNLLPPYTHQYANGCGRMDIFPMTVMYFLFKNDLLHWPNKNGKISLTLEQLNLANQWTQGKAHNAMSDVETTLALAQRLYQDQKMWNYLTPHFNKQWMMKKLPPIHSLNILFDGVFGSDHFFHIPVLFLGTHHHYKNQLLWLRLDTDQISKTNLDSIAETKIIKTKWGEPHFTFPFADPFLKHLSKERIQQSEQNKQWLEQHLDVLDKIKNHHAEYQYPVYPDTDINAKLYNNGFFGPEEEQYCRTFHHATSEKKASLTDQINHPILQPLSLRILGRHYPEVLLSHQKEQFNQYLHKIYSTDTKDSIFDYKREKKLTAQTALMEIHALRNNNSNPLLDELEHYIMSTQTTGLL